MSKKEYFGEDTKTDGQTAAPKRRGRKPKTDSTGKTSKRINFDSTLTEGPHVTIRVPASLAYAVGQMVGALMQKDIQ